MANSRARLDFIDQPMTAREYESMITARYSQPSAVRRYVMSVIITKYLVTATVVAGVSELAKRSDRLGALLASLPLVTLLALIWLYVEKQPASKITNHAWYTFWCVMPTLQMFLLFPKLFERFGFSPALALSAVITILCFGGFALLVKPFGTRLL